VGSVGGSGVSETMRDAPSRLPQRIGLTALLLLIGACQGSSRSPPSVPVAAAAPTVRIDEEPAAAAFPDKHAPARTIGISDRACRPYRAKTKGKVERPIHYVRHNFVYGREFLGDSELNAQALGWLDCTANARLHGTTRECRKRDSSGMNGPRFSRWLRAHINHSSSPASA